MSEIKACPFCGEMPETDGRLVQCYLMPCSARNFKMSIDSWNTRPIEDALNARIAELEGLVDKLIEVGELLAEYCDYETGKIAWDALVKDWKKREE